MRAVKIGIIGPLEIRIAQCASRSIPKYISHKTEGIHTHLIMGLAAGRLEMIPTNARKVVTFLCKALLDVSNKSGNQIVHGDIKPENIIVTAKGTLKLIDWGCATLNESIPLVEKGGYYAPVGTPGYLPPEAFSEDNPITTKFDSWAIGATLYKLLSRNQPLFTGENPNNPVILLQLPQYEAEFKEKLAALPRAEGVPELIYEVMKQLLRVNPAERISPTEALNLISNPPSVTLPAALGSRQETHIKKKSPKTHHSRPRGGSPTRSPYLAPEMKVKPSMRSRLTSVAKEKLPQIHSKPKFKA
jgi:serine/threonine protein kinase